MEPVILPEWFDRSAVTVAPELIGCILVRQLPDGTQLRGIIVETEAYQEGDPACHARAVAKAGNHRPDETVPVVPLSSSDRYLN